MSIRYYIQKILGRWLGEPLIPRGKTVGFSLVRSEKSNVVLGQNTKVYPPFFMHDVYLGDFSYVAKNCTVANSVIGKFCSIGPNFNCGLGIHPIEGISTSPMFYSASKQNGITLCKENKVEESPTTIIGNDVFIGANVTVLNGVHIGDGAVIGAGAVVTKDIPPYAIAVGVPASVKRYRFDSETISSLLAMRWWDGDMAIFQKLEKNFWNVKDFLNAE